MNAIIRKDRDLDPFLSLARDWMSPRRLRDFFSSGLMGDALPAWNEEVASILPDFDVKENNGSFVIKADLPGIKSEDLDVKVQDRRLTISGKREGEKEEKGETTYRSERWSGSFARSFTLPEAVDANKVNAELKDGVLTLTLTKKNQTPVQSIKVKSA